MISQQSAAARPAAPQHSGRCLLTTSITATSVAGALEELGEASRAGADVAELRLDFLADFDAKNALPALLQGSSLPVIVTFRPDWEGGNYSGPEDQRLRALWLAVQLGAAYVDVELKAAAQFFASSPQASGETSRVTKIILSSHNYTETPSIEDLCRIHRAAVAAGADIVKIAAMCQHITDVHRLQALLTEERTRPTIALGMGEAGQVSIQPRVKLHLETDIKRASCCYAGIPHPCSEIRKLPHVWSASSWQGIGARADDDAAVDTYIPVTGAGTSGLLRRLHSMQELRCKVPPFSFLTPLPGPDYSSPRSDWKPNIAQPEPTHSQCGAGLGGAGHGVRAA